MSDEMNDSVESLNLQLDPFSSTNPEGWFNEAEEAMGDNDVTDVQEKCCLILGAMEPCDIKKVIDLVSTVKTKRDYEEFKKTILKRFEQALIRKLEHRLMEEKLCPPNHEVLKPSTFLYQLRNLVEDDVPDEVLKVVWINKLPWFLQKALRVGKENTRLDDLADIADVATEDFMHKCSEFGVEDEIGYLKGEIKKLNTEIDALKVKLKGAYDKLGLYTPYETLVCWYHRVYEEKAHSCTEGCIYKLLHKPKEEEKKDEKKEDEKK